MRAIAALPLLAISLLIGAFGQAARKTSTFTSRDGVFRFVYPSDFQVCTKGKLEPCSYTYMPVCVEDALVCVLYPEQKFKGTNFGAASFQVREILKGSIPPNSADYCVTPETQDHPGFMISAEHPTAVIGGISFIHGNSDGAAMGHSNETQVYRAFHKGRCFELSVSETETDPDMSEPRMKTLTPAQNKDIEQTMSKVLHSFRFTN